MSKRPMFQQPDPKALEDEEARRAALEVQSSGLLNGRTLNRVNRPVQIGLKTSQDKKRQFDRLRLLTRWSYTDIFEAALDAFEAAWKEGRIK